jgi:hypothetical protein
MAVGRWFKYKRERGISGEDVKWMQFSWLNQTNWQWLNTASAGDIASNSKTPRSYPPNVDTWTG